MIWTAAYLGNDVDIYNASTDTWSVAQLAQGRMRLASASAGRCAVFAGGEVNTSNNDASGIVRPPLPNI
eukprot:COSAG05_NODE_138_length_16837_cov_344.961286_5_plen_69_part_00